MALLRKNRGLSHSYIHLLCRGEARIKAGLYHEAIEDATTVSCFVNIIVLIIGESALDYCKKTTLQVT
jgi:hypothetical protein